MEKSTIIILQALGGAGSMGIVQRAYATKGYRLGFWQTVLLFAGYLLILVIGDVCFGYIGQFCGFALFVVIGLLRVASLPANHSPHPTFAAPSVSPVHLPTITFTCSCCKKAISAEPSMAGEVSRCPLCNGYIRVPYPKK